MEENQNKEKLIHQSKNFYKNNKLKIFSTIIILIVIAISSIILKFNNKNKNTLTSEKYIQAEILLTSGKTNEAKNIYEEIISRKNNFYSVLSLNRILENNLEKNEEKILDYFRIVESLSYSKDQNDLLILKKGLFLIKSSKITEGKKLLKKIVESNSNYKSLAVDLLNDK